MKFSFPEFAIRRPVTVWMINITVIGLGVIAVSRMPLEFMPKIQFPFMGVFIAYPGATPPQVEEEVAIPAEGEFRTLPDLKRLFSSSSSDGCFIGIEFKSGTDLHESIADVRDRIERIRLDLPQGADNVFIQHFNSDALPVMQFGLARDGDEKEFAHLVRTDLLPKIKRLDGVAEIEIWGADEDSVMVEFDQNALRRHNLSIYQVIALIRESNVNVSAGQLTGGRQKFLVRALDEFNRPEELAELVVGNGLRLKDVASVGYRPRNEDRLVEMDGKKEIFLVVTKKSEANTVAACSAVTRELDRLLARPEYSGVNKIVFFNQGDIIVDVLKGLVNAGVSGGILSTIILFMFLARVRPTLVVTLSIPGTMLVAAIYMYFTGMSINLVTLMSLIIGVGMVVDNSIVVVENIYRYRELGLSTLESTGRGAREMALAITASTATSVVVFVPVLYLEDGPLSVFLRQFAIPMSVSMLASLLFALTFIPLTVSRFHDAPVRDGAAPRFVRLKAMWRRINPVGPVMRGYMACLRFSVRQRLVTLAIMVGFTYLTMMVPMKRVGFQAEPVMDRREVRIDFEFDANYDMAMATERMDLIEERINARREELGIKNVFKHYTPHWGELQLLLKGLEDLAPGEKILFTSDEVAKVLSEDLPDRIPGGRLRINSNEDEGGQEGGGVALRLMGDDAETIDEYAEQIMAVLRRMPGVTEVDTTSRAPDQEIRLGIDEDLANRAGVSPMAVAQTVGFALNGSRMPEMKYNGREVPVWAQFREEDRKSKANLDNVMLLGDTGNLVPLVQLVDFEHGTSPRSIERTDGKNYAWISVKSTDTDLAGIRADMLDIANSFDLPPGYSISMGDDLMALQEGIAGFVATLGLAVVLVYVVMAAVFESWVLPLSILMSVPLAFLGVYWAMFITHSPMDTVAFVGCILMVGVVVNNGIVIVDHINNLRREGINRHEAVIAAGRDRLRPVLMTALTTILGAVPVAIGGSPGADAVTGLGRSMIGGLTTGTFLTLFVVPLFYTFFDDLQVWARGFIGDLLNLGGPRRVAPGLVPGGE